MIPSRAHTATDVLRRLLVLLAALCVGACGEGETPTKPEQSKTAAPATDSQKATPPKQATPASKPAAPAVRPSGVVLPAGQFPSMALFGSSGWFQAAGTSSLRVATEELLTLEEKMGAMSRSVEETMSGASATDEDTEDASQAIFRRLVPGVFGRLSPCWDRTDWSVDEITYANAAAAFIHRHADAPEVTFSDNKSAKNRDALVKLADWFRVQARDADWLGASFFTMDDGPMVGAPVASGVGVKVERSLPLGDALVLECCRPAIEDDTGGIVRVRDGDAVQWTRRFTRESGKPHQRVRFSSSRVQAVGPYGWHINFSADGEGASLYIGPTGTLLFYFVSW